jgi:glycine/D-amino acid oxidase-like deaminating enzyme
MGRDPREIPLMLESERIWKSLNEIALADTGYRAAGIAYLCATEADVARREEWLDHAREFQIDTRMISGTALRNVP